MPRRKLITTYQAAAELGIDPRTLNRWRERGMVHPEVTTAGGHHRWDLKKLKDQLRQLRPESE